MSCHLSGNEKKYDIEQEAEPEPERLWPFRLELTFSQPESPPLHSPLPSPPAVPRSRASSQPKPQPHGH